MVQTNLYTSKALGMDSLQPEDVIVDYNIFDNNTKLSSVRVFGDVTVVVTDHLFYKEKSLLDFLDPMFDDLVSHHYLLSS
nr:12740_t:CDS:2 [Entrophospora candida]